jgi:hypothetical protein
MLEDLDIFRVEPNGQMLWQDTAATMELARLRIKILMVARPADYVIYNQETGEKIVVRSEGSDFGKVA